MSFAASIFTLEVNQTPTLVFEAKWLSEAEAFGFEWARDHADRLTTKGSYGTDLPAVLKVRIARPDEKAVYRAQGSPAQFHQGIKIIYLDTAAALDLGLP